jgi:hypothetical protein
MGKPAGDVHPLLLTAGKGGRRQRPQPFGDAQAGQQVAHALARRIFGHPTASSGSATTSSVGTRGTTRRNWLT